MSQLSTAVILTAFLAACTTDITNLIHEEIAQDDMPCEQDPVEIDTRGCSEDTE